MSAISLKSITGITSITTPAGVDNQLTLHNNNTSEAVKLDAAGNLHFHNHLNITGVSTASNFKTGTSNLHNTGLNVQDLDVDGHTNLDNVSVAGVTTFSGGVTVNASLDLNGDIDVDGHTNLDNVNIAGVTTSGHLTINGDLTVNDNYPSIYLKDYDSDSDFMLQNQNGIFTVYDATNNADRFEILSNGTVRSPHYTLQSQSPSITFNDTNHDSDFMIQNANGLLKIYDNTNGADRFGINSSGSVYVYGNELYIGDSIIHNGDVDTKIRFPAADTVTVETAGDERLRIDSTGRVLIGTTNADSVGSIDQNVVIGSTTNAEEVALTLNVMEGTNNRRVKFFLDDNDGVFGLDSTASTGVSPFVVRMATSEKLRITSGGHVNIGGLYTQTSYGLSVRGGAVDQNVQFSNTKSANGNIHYIGITLTNGGFGQALFGHTGHTTAGEQAAWMGLAGDDVAGGTGVKCFRGGKVQMGASTTLQAFINNSVSGHQFISQCSDNNNGFEIYQKHGSTATRKTLAVYANTGNSAAKQIQFEVRGDNTTHAYGTKNTTLLSLNTAQGISGAHSYGDENRLDFLMYNEVPQFTGNPAARIAGYLQRGNNGYGLRFYARYNASTLYKAMEITANYEVLPGSNGTVDLGNASNRWKNVYTSDLDLSNEAKGGNDVDGTWGSYTIQEGESDLFLINKRNGKKYKFLLKEVD